MHRSAGAGNNGLWPVDTKRTSSGSMANAYHCLNGCILSFTTNHIFFARFHLFSACDTFGRSKENMMSYFFWWGVIADRYGGCGMGLPDGSMPFLRGIWIRMQWAMWMEYTWFLRQQWSVASWFSDRHDGVYDGCGWVTEYALSRAHPHP